MASPDYNELDEIDEVDTRRDWQRIELDTVRKGPSPYYVLIPKRPAQPPHWVRVARVQFDHALNYVMHFFAPLAPTTAPHRIHDARDD